MRRGTSALLGQLPIVDEVAYFPRPPARNGQNASREALRQQAAQELTTLASDASASQLADSY